MDLTYSQLETTLASYLQIKPDRIGTLRSRIKQLQRLEFPDGVNVGRGTKMVYNGSHLFKLVTAFELIGLGLPAQTATNLVTLHWSGLSGAYGLCWIHRARFKDREGVLAALTVQTMSDLQFSTLGGVRPSRLRVMDTEYAAKGLSYHSNGDPGADIYIDMKYVYNRVIKTATEQAGVFGIYTDSEVRDWIPKGKVSYFSFLGPYPDRSNLEMRRYLHEFARNDPDCLTPEGELEAAAFASEIEANFLNLKLG